jgi:transcription elongation factor GreA
MQRTPMTLEGEKKIKQELERLEKIERPKTIQAISEARAHGDLKENAEYHAAKEQQGFIEARIRDIRHKLSHIQVIDVTKIPNNGTVIFGVTVTLCNLETEEKLCYKIVGEDEADIKNKKISISSPVARALIGKAVGDEVEVRAPSGNITFEITAVEHF